MLKENKTEEPIENLTMINLLLRAANACDSEAYDFGGNLLRQAAKRIEHQQELIYHLENRCAKQGT